MSKLSFFVLFFSVFLKDTHGGLSKMEIVVLIIATVWLSICNF